MAVYDNETLAEGPNPQAFALEWLSGWDRILELGPANGALTRCLSESGAAVVAVEFDPEYAASLAGVADTVLERDLDTVTEAELEAHGPFDAAVATDVLEHLRDPDRVVALLERVLRPDGVLVVSLPNVAHADVRLALMSGRFEMTDQGLLDRTHLRFFTFESARDLLERHGFEVTDVRRTKEPIGGTEQAGFCDPEMFSLRERLAKDEEADTYQFVMRAAKRGKPIVAVMREARLARDSADAAAAEANRLRAEVEDLRARVQGLSDERERLVAECDGLRAELARAARIEEAVRALPRTSGAVRFAARLSRLRNKLSPASPTLEETLDRVVSGGAGAQE